MTIQCYLFPIYDGFDPSEDDNSSIFVIINHFTPWMTQKCLIGGKIKRFLAFFRKMKIVDLWELLKKWPNFVHFWFRLSTSNDFFQPILFRCSFRSYTLWNHSLSSKNFFSQEIGHKRSYDGRNLSQKMTSFEINKEFERSKTWQKRSIDVRNIISSINVKKTHENSTAH